MEVVGGGGGGEVGAQNSLQQLDFGSTISKFNKFYSLMKLLIGIFFLVNLVGNVKMH